MAVSSREVRKWINIDVMQKNNGADVVIGAGLKKIYVHQLVQLPRAGTAKVRQSLHSISTLDTHDEQTQAHTTVYNSRP